MVSVALLCHFYAVSDANHNVSYCHSAQETKATRGRANGHKTKTIVSFRPFS